MATLTIHNISDDLLEKLERSAMERGLSVEDEAIRRILSTKFTLNEREREELMERVRKNRRKMAEEGVWLTEEVITRSKHDVSYPYPPDYKTSEPSQQLDPWLERARALRESMPDVHIGDEEELNRFKREGRL